MVCWDIIRKSGNMTEKSKLSFTYMRPREPQEQHRSEFRDTLYIPWPYYKLK